MRNTAYCVLTALPKHCKLGNIHILGSSHQQLCCLVRANSLLQTWCLLAVFLHGRNSAGLPQAWFIRYQCDSCGCHLCDLINSFRLHPLTLSSWGLGFNTLILKRCVQTTVGVTSVPSILSLQSDLRAGAVVQGIQLWPVMLYPV